MPQIITFPIWHMPRWNRRRPLPALAPTAVKRGRKSKPDFIAEAALLSRELQVPVKVVWSRQDDIQHDYYHAVAACRIEAGVDQGGKPQAWLMRSAFPSIGSTFDASADAPADWEMGFGYTDMP